MSEDLKDQNEEELINQEETVTEEEVINDSDDNTESITADEEKTLDEINNSDHAISEDDEQEEEPKSAEEVIAELELTMLRQRADFDNFRKRSVRDQEDARQRGKMSVLEDVLPVYDTFKMAMQATQMDNVNLDMIVQGMNMIQNMFVKAMDDMGVEELNAIGQKFDPNFHEATSESFSDEVDEGMVLTQTRCGYKLGERLLRAAMVTVSKGPEPELTEDDSNEEVGED
jgi:molecular chaperone GrpE